MCTFRQIYACLLSISTSFQAPLIIHSDRPMSDSWRAQKVNLMLGLIVDTSETGKPYLPCNV